jgi:hypothetical protein
VGEVRDFAGELAQRLEAQRDEKGAALVTGHPKSGKSSALWGAAGRLKRKMVLLRAEVRQVVGGTEVRLVLKDDKGTEVVLDDSDRGLDFVRERIKEGAVVVVELPKSLYLPGTTEEWNRELKRKLNGLVDGLKTVNAGAPLAIEGNAYTFRFIEEEDGGAGAEEPEGWLRRIGQRLGSMIKHGRVVLKPPEGSVEVVYGEAEARALLRNLAGDLSREDEELVLRSSRVNHGTHKGHYFPGLLAKAAERHGELDEGEIGELEDFEKGLAVEAVGIGLADVAAQEIQDAPQLARVLGAASKILSALTVFSVVTAASVGVFLLLGMAEKGRGDPVRQSLKMRKKWEKLPEERKEYLGYQYDASLGLPPGTARRWLDDFFHQSEGDIRQRIGKLSGDIEELGKAVRELEEKIAELEEETATTAGYRRLDSEDDARDYFGVEGRSSLEPVWTIVDEASQESVAVNELIEGLTEDAKSGKGRVYLVRGEAGVGKSAMACYVSYKLLSRSGVEGEGLQVQAAYRGFKPAVLNGRRTVVFLDDHTLSEYEKEISDVLKGVVELMRDGGEGGSGLSYPLVITVSDERWYGVEAALLRDKSTMITSQEHRKIWRKLYREGKVIRRLTVSPLKEEEAKRVLKSIMEEGDPPMNYDEQDGDVIEELLNKAGGYPLILKEFVKEIRGKGKKRIEKSDVQAISGRPREYMVNRLKETYFRPLELLNTGRDLLDSVPYDRRGEACKLLSFLYQLMQGLPAGLLLPGLADASPPGALVDSARGVLEGLYRDCRPTFGMSLPLCSSFLGLVKLSHPLTSDILEEARRVVEGGEEGWDGSLSFLRHLSCKGGQFEDVRVKDFVEDAINHYKRGMRFTGLDPGDYFYGFFSLLLYLRNEDLIRDALLSQDNLKDPGRIGDVPEEEVRREVLGQLYELLAIIHAFDSRPDDGLKAYYLLLLGNDHGQLAPMWGRVPDLIKAGLISGEEAAAHKERLLELLESGDERWRSLAWRDVPRLIEAGLISGEEAAAHKERLLELLESNSEWLKLRAWYDVPRLIEAGLISGEEAAAHKERLLELLESGDELVRSVAWDAVLILNQDNVISREDKERPLELLESNIEWVRAYAWWYVPDLIEAGVISGEEAAAHKERLLELLESGDEEVRMFAWWWRLPPLIRAGVISREEAAAHKERFMELLESGDERVRAHAREHVPDLIKAGVISRGDVKRRGRRSA